MSEKNIKKLVFTGPTGVGKTTIKKVFFNHANPLKLKRTTLEPTIGAEIEDFKFLDSSIGVFDLAGQENKKWYNKEKQIFTDTDMILCVFDATTTIELISEYIDEIINIKDNVCKYAKIYFIIHKIDLVSKKERYILERRIKEYIEFNHKSEKEQNILSTSIDKDLFFNSFVLFQDIIFTLLQKTEIDVTFEEYRELLLILRFLLSFDDDVWYSSHMIERKLNLDTVKAESLMNILKLQDLIEIKEEDFITFKLSINSSLLLSGLSNIQSKIMNENNLYENNLNDNDYKYKYQSIDAKDTKALFFLILNMKKAK